MLGNSNFRKLSAELAYGDAISRERPIATCQTISGTGALSIASFYLSSFGPKSKCVYVPTPTLVA